MGSYDLTSCRLRMRRSLAGGSLELCMHRFQCEPTLRKRRLQIRSQMLLHGCAIRLLLPRTLRDIVDSVNHGVIGTTARSWAEDLRSVWTDPAVFLLELSRDYLVVSCTVCRCKPG
jgi:hypothetical protein